MIVCHMSVDDSYFQTMSDMLNSESKKLEIQIDTAMSARQLSVSEIVSLYHQITNVSSIKKMLHQYFETHESSDESNSLFEKIEKLVSKFNSDLHPRILSQLKNSVSNSMNELKNSKNVQSSKIEIENNAKLYDQLREIMSTREFVEQYDKGLLND